MASNIEYIRKLRSALAALLQEDIFHVTSYGKIIPVTEAQKALECPHTWAPTGLSTGTCISYACNICDEETEKDVS